MCALAGAFTMATAADASLRVELTFVFTVFGAQPRVAAATGGPQLKHIFHFALSENDATRQPCTMFFFFRTPCTTLHTSRSANATALHTLDFPNGVPCSIKARSV